MPQVATPPGRAPEPPRRRDDLARSAPAWCRDHVSGPGAADRPGLDPASPAGTGQAATVTAAAAGPVLARILAAAAALSAHAGTGSYLRVWMTCSRVGPGWPVASPVIHRTPGPGSSDRRRDRGLSPGRSPGRWTPDLLPSLMAATRVRQSRRVVPSRAGSAGVILRGWELISRPGCHRRPGQCGRCRSQSRSLTRTARGRRGQPDPGRLQPGGVRRRVLVPRGRLGRPVRPYPDPLALCRHPGCSGPGDGLARGWLWRCRGWWSKRRGG